MDYIFVFGSNLAGIHGAGAALHARKYFGALQGIGIGRQGQSFAIPTKDKQIRTLPLAIIRQGVRKFLEHAEANPNETFLVTNVGCGLAGYTPNDIAPMFVGAPNNCEFSPEFGEILFRESGVRYRTRASA